METLPLQYLTVGRIVLYVLSYNDVQGVNSRRLEERWHKGVGHSSEWPVGPQAREGYLAVQGDIVPAIVVKPQHNSRQSTFDGQAFLDGNDVLWLTSVPYSEEPKPGTWHWPPGRSYG